MSRTIHALRASARRNVFHSVTALPGFATTVLNSFTPSTNTLTKPARLSNSTSPRGRANRHARPTTNGAQRIEVSNIGSPLQFVELAHVHRGERFADAKDEDAQHHHCDHHIKKDPDFDDERHSV